MSTKHLPTTGAVDKAGVAGIQDLVRDLLAELDRVATAARIPYFLAYGTALGAVRDHDLIGWDVDADVWLPHAHHRRFLDEAVPLLGPDYELLTAETHDDYEFLFPRLVRKGVHHVFVRVDVFPLDPAPRTRAGGSAYVRLMYLLTKVFFVKRARTDVRLHYSARKRLLTGALRVLTLPLPDGALIALFRRLQAGGGQDRLVNSCGAYGDRELFDAAWFDEGSSALVGSRSFPVPSGVDPLLTQLYGDYRTPVPEDRQLAELRHATAAFVEPLREQGVIS